MSEIKCPDNYVFGLDIGTRSLVGTIGYEDSYGFHVVAMEVMEHATRAMLDGQVHDISVVGEEIKQVKEKLKRKKGNYPESPLIAACYKNTPWNYNQGNNTEVNKNVRLCTCLCKSYSLCLDHNFLYVLCLMDI